MQIARASNPVGTTAIWVRDRLDGLWRDEVISGIDAIRVDGGYAGWGRRPRG
ncbi:MULTISPECIES: hypothetical protein [unclassified Streptomyces]|uniref:hypothetical protein n=1 Tax=unclassified Streptomyces TaxID=2593676 RepID=UPI0018FE3757|nr:hypothetical protein [Streptomyces sp. CB01580]